MSDSQLDPRTLAYIQNLVQAASMTDDWKGGLDKLLIALRNEFVFDNVVIYVVDPATLSLEVEYARAVGRGKAAEADAAWGESLANLVLARESMIVQDPVEGATERLSQAYLLGLPLYDGSKAMGVMIFVRFGGPAYKDTKIPLAIVAGSWASALLNRKAHKETQQQLDALRQKVQLQDDFLATISHELRTPLGFIKGYSTTLLRSDITWDSEVSKEFLTIIDEEADRLAQLIDNILESAKLQSRSVQLNVQPLRLDALIRDVVIRVRTRHKDLDVDLQLEAVPPIQGDNVRLTQVFENLFSNAVKYAEGAKISVVAKPVGDSLLVTFSDQGPGIPRAYLPYIFERFYRVPGDRSNTGSGLGLYICNQIIMAHRGKIWVESELNQGTTFYIQLPIESMF
ncbi:MAG: HAMP domain-containing histidine kinase [Anaerolineales bacterium]|nr:HAMP domain-containing histidine kinase [Anaerolineales bacterium]